jgi:hypothetical protein
LQNVPAENRNRQTDKLARFESLTEAVAKNATEIVCSADRSVLQGEIGASSAQLLLLLLLLLLLCCCCCRCCRRRCRRRRRLTVCCPTVIPLPTLIAMLHVL